MSAFAWLFALQLGIASAALVVIAKGAHRLLFVSSVDTAPLTAAVREFLQTNDLQALRALIERLPGTHYARLLRVVVDARSEGSPLEDRVSEAAEDLHAEAFGTLFLLRTLGRIAPPLAFAVAMVVLSLGFGKEAGLVALQRGLAESIAISQAMLAVVMGMTTSFVCRYAADRTLGWATALHEQLERCTDATMSDSDAA